MNPHDRRPDDAIPEDRLAAVMWEARKGARVARCELWRHPLGWEVRCDVDVDVRQTAVQRRRETAEGPSARLAAGV